MDSGQTTSAAKVVLFARADGALRAATGRAAGLVQTPTAYEAAAELLAGPTAALVIELPLLAPCHARLLRLAGDLGVPALGVGTPRRAIRCEDLHPLRQLALDELGERLAEICREFDLSMSTFAAAGEIEAQLQHEIPEPAPARTPSESEPQSEPQPAMNAFLSGAAAAREEDEAEDEPAPGAYVPEMHPPQRDAAVERKSGTPGKSPASPPGEPSALLSSEELSALLGDQP